MFALTLISAVLAQDATGSLLIGVGYDGPQQDNPETMRISLRGETPVVPGDTVSLGVVFPLGIASSSDSGFGWSSQNTAIELAPSARLRVLNGSPLRLYADAGVGAIWRFSETDTWFGDGTSRRTGMMTRTALGAEIGGSDPGTVALVIEPISFQRYGFDEDGVSRLSSMVGISGRF